MGARHLGTRPGVGQEEPARGELNIEKLVDDFAQHVAAQTVAAFEASESLKRWEEGAWALDPE